MRVCGRIYCPLASSSSSSVSPFHTSGGEKLVSRYRGEKNGLLVSWFLSGPPQEDKKEDILLFPPPWHQRNGRTKEKMALEDIKWDKGRNGRSEEIDEDSPG